MNTSHMAIVIASTLLMSATPSMSARGQEKTYQFDQMASEGLIAMPEDLNELVRKADAAVIGEIVGLGELIVEEKFSTGGTRLGPIGLAPYRVRIDEIVFNKAKSAVPSLMIGAEIDLFKQVGSEEAKAFVARTTKVAAKDECLLFLTHNARSPRWAIAPWQLQFRKSRIAERSAEVVLPAPDMNWLEGRTLAVTRVENRITVDWDSLVSEVKRASALQGKQ